jgi:hypothetical protein
MARYWRSAFASESEAIQGPKSKSRLLGRFRLRLSRFGGQAAPRQDEEKFSLDKGPLDIEKYSTGAA